MKHKPYIGKSDAQANAEALHRRDHTYTEASSASFTVAWDWHNRQPQDLREAVRMVRQAYADEVPTKLHEGPDSIGDDGTPKMAARAMGYIFGSPWADDAKRGEDPLITYLQAPFRALLADWQRHRPEYAKIVSHVAIGRMPPRMAAELESVPAYCSKIVATDALFSFLAKLTDIKVNAPRYVDEDTTAA